MLDALFKPHMDRLWAPVGQWANRIGLTPDGVTYLSLVLCLGNAAAYTVHRRAWVFGLGLLLFEALDNVDGALARATDRCTAWGSYLDAVTDRYKDAVAILAVGVVWGLWAACCALLAGSLLVSYTQARAQAQNAASDPRGVLPMFERLERVVVLALGLMATHFFTPPDAPVVLGVVLWGSAFFTHLTALQRIRGAWRVLRGRDKAAATTTGATTAIAETTAAVWQSAPPAAKAMLGAADAATGVVGEARRCYAARKGDTEWRGDWPAFVLFRPLSFALTPWALACGVSANALTAACGALACALPLVAFFAPPTQGFWSVGLLGGLFQLLDCLDGNVARVRRTVSARGDYLSMLVGQGYWLLLLTAFGQLAAAASGDRLQVYGLACGVALGALVALGRLCREYVLPRGAAVANAGAPRDAGWAARLRLFGSGLDNLIFLVVLLAGLCGGLPAAFAGTGLYVVGLFTVTQLESWRALRG